MKQSTQNNIFASSKVTNLLVIGILLQLLIASVFLQSSSVDASAVCRFNGEDAVGLNFQKLRNTVWRNASMTVYSASEGALTLTAFSSESGTSWQGKLHHNGDLSDTFDLSGNTSAGGAFGTSSSLSIQPYCK